LAKPTLSPLRVQITPLDNKIKKAELKVKATLEKLATLAAGPKDTVKPVKPAAGPKDTVKPVKPATPAAGPKDTVKPVPKRV